MADVKKLTPAMQELLDAMGKGVRVLYAEASRGYDAHYFRTDTMRSCSKQVDGLRDRGLVEIVENRVHIIPASKGGQHE